MSPETSSAASRKRKSSWIRAVIVTDGAAVYSKANFDSPVQDYLRFQTTALVSKKAYPGIGGLGLFHRIRYNKNKLGYITDTDIRISREVIEQLAPAAKEKSPSKAWEKEEEEALGKAPLYFTRYLGGALAQVNFTEKFSGRKLSDDMLMYGLRMSGPGTLFDGPPLDFNFWFSMQKPGYYSQFSSGDPTGFLLFGDVMAQLPLVDTDKVLVTYGLGIMWVYTRYSVPVRGVSFDSQEFRVGLDAGLGAGFRIGKFMLRGDVKYYYEKTQYLGYVLSLQREY